MKKFNFFLVILSLTLLLAACGGDSNSESATEDSATDNTTEEETSEDTEESDTTESEYEPEEINEETDVCDVCAMAVPDNQHATQIVLQNDKSLKFDDLGCLYEWKDENGEDDIGAEFVRDFHSEEWIQIKDTTFVYDEEIETPMAYGVISFKDKAEAEKYIEDEGKGEILDAAALADHEWKMNKEMMDHGDHDDHDDMDHDDHDDHDEE